MKKLLFVTENERQTILEMHGFINNPNVINEEYTELEKIFKNPYAELEKIFKNPFVKGLEKSNPKAFDELSKILDRRADETLSGAFDRVLSKAVDNGSRADGVNVLKFCKQLSLINDQFAEEFYKNQIEVINKIRLHPEYSKQWELMVKNNFGEKVLEKYKKNNMGSVKPVEKTPTEPKPSEKPAEQKPTPPKPAEQVKPQTGISRGNFKVGQLNNGSKFDKSIDAVFQKVFYEGNDKRFDMFPMEVVNKFTPETKSYLLQLLDIIKQKNLANGLELGFRNDFNRLPKTVDEEIQMLSTNFWGGYGRKGGLQGILDQAPSMPSSVAQNLFDVTMSQKQQDELLAKLEKIRGN
jgi:hypothetical protein